MITQTPLVTIICPVYNAEKYILESLESLQKQSYTNIEVITVDNNSSDKSYDICKTIAQQDIRFKTLKNTINMGAPFSLNRGIEKANGKYITFHDSDDVMYHKKIEKCVSTMHGTSQPDIVYSMARCIDENGKPNGNTYFFEKNLTKNPYFPRGIERIYGIGTWGIFAKKSLVSMFLFDENFQVNYDFELLLRIILSKKKFTFIKQPLIDVRIHPGSLSTLHKKSILQEIYRKNITEHSVFKIFTAAKEPPYSALKSMATIFLQLEKPERALNYLLQIRNCIVSTSKDQQEIEFLKASAYFLLKNYKKSFKYLHKQLNSSLFQAESYNNIGVCQALEGKYKSAQELFSTAIKYFPHYKDAYNNLKNIKNHSYKFQYTVLPIKAISKKWAN